MKTIVALIVLFALVAIFAACSSDDNGGFLAEDVNEGVSDERIGQNPAALSADREEAVREVAEKLFADSIPQPSQDIDYGDALEDVVRGVAVVLVTGEFLEDGQWLEKFAEVKLARTSGGNWIITNDPIFDLTIEERGRQREITEQAEKEARHQAEIAKLNRIAEAFDQVSMSVTSVEKIPDSNDPEDGIGGLRFHLQVENPTDSSHHLGYVVEWTQITFSPSTSVCSPDRRPVREREVESPWSVEVLPNTVTEEEMEPSNTGFFHQVCIDATIEDAAVSINKIDGYGRDRLEEELADLQTSPD